MFTSAHHLMSDDSQICVTTALPCLEGKMAICLQYRRVEKAIAAD